jgi:hypothetical protein
MVSVIANLALFFIAALALVPALMTILILNQTR